MLMWRLFWVMVVSGAMLMLPPLGRLVSVNSLQVPGFGFGSSPAEAPAAGCGAAWAAPPDPKPGRRGRGERGAFAGGFGARLRWGGGGSGGFWRLGAWGGGARSPFV